ncbi:MAG: AMP-binding protein, partial [Acidobacteria bacterium]|nr:AMP-binding protein [Acidobacteriota bacterium]
MHFVPSMLQAFLEAPDLTSCRSLRRVFASGEALPAELVRRFYERLAGVGNRRVELHNLYGPTEAAIDVTFHPTTPTERTTPIGRPVANTRVHVVDRHGAPQPPGIPGELLLGGVQLARGYDRRPALTAERFVPDPFAATPGERLYRTGDLVRWRGDGEILFLGRLDHQVKLRGLRIELGEIESALDAQPGVRECAVLVREDEPGDQRLVAYVVRDASAGGEGADLRAALKQRLPDYMVPG